MNEKLLVGVISALGIMGLLLIPASGMAAAEIMVLHLIQIALLLMMVFITFYFLHGTEFDVWHEIAPDHKTKARTTPNIALAIVMAALILGIANVIAR